MLKTKKLLPRKLAANQVVVTMQEAVTNVISANLNVLYVTRDQGRKVWVALGTTAGTLAAQNLRLLKTTVAAANDKSVAAWDAVEQALDERVMPVLDKVGLAAPAPMRTPKRLESASDFRRIRALHSWWAARSSCTCSTGAIAG